MGSLVLVTQHLKDYFNPDVSAATKAFDCCSWKIMLNQEIDTLQSLKNHPQLKVFLGNEQQEALLCSLRPNPPYYSELAIFGPGVQGIIARLPLDEFIRMLYSTNPQEYQDRRRKKEGNSYYRCHNNSDREEKKSVKIFSFLFSSFLALLSYSKDYGTHGPVFAIAEENLLEVIQRKLLHLQKTEKIVAINKDIQRRVKQSAQEPKAAHHLPCALKYHRRLFDSSITMPEDIRDPEGKVIIKGGTRVNPLDYVQWRDPMLFINGMTQTK